jgi:hypothetical protein
MLDQPYVYRFWVETGGGTGTFLDVQTVSVQANAIALVAGDWDGNGSLDLSAADNGSDSVHILDNQP